MASLGERMKSYEIEDRVSKDKHIVFRVDGKNFSKFTKKFNKPFDVRFTKAMVRTMNEVMKEFKAATAFCCSDEITFVIPAKTGDETCHDNNGRVQKLNSLLAATCSVYFKDHILEEIADTENEEVIREHINKVKPRFDSRLMQFTTEQEIDIYNNIYWRSRYDCYRNTVSSIARYIMGQKNTQNKKSPEMIAEMKSDYDFDFVNDVHYCLQYGVYGKKCTVKLVNDNGEEYIRHHVKNFTFKISNPDVFVPYILAKYDSGTEYEDIGGRLLFVDDLDYRFTKES